MCNVENLRKYVDWTPKNMGIHKYPGSVIRSAK